MVLGWILFPCYQMTAVVTSLTTMLVTLLPTRHSSTFVDIRRCNPLCSSLGTLFAVHRCCSQHVHAIRHCAPVAVISKHVSNHVNSFLVVAILTGGHSMAWGCPYPAAMLPVHRAVFRSRLCLEHGTEERGVNNREESRKILEMWIECSDRDFRLSLSLRSYNDRKYATYTSASATLRLVVKKHSENSRFDYILDPLESEREPPPFLSYNSMPSESKWPRFFRSQSATLSRNSKGDEEDDVYGANS